MNLTLDFGGDSPAAALEHPPTLSLSPVQRLVERFEQLMSQDASPVRAIRRAPARPARFGPFPDKLDPRLKAALLARGIADLYTHQAAAVQSALEGRNTVIVTPTASGKTLCYNLPVVNTIL